MSSARPTWRLVLGSGLGVSTADLTGDGARNMAVDQVLLDATKAGAPSALRLYRWDPACLSLGRNQPAHGRYDRNGRVPGRDIVRRPTGGLAVFHDQELTYAVACAVGELGSPRATYLRVHRALAAGLAALGAPAALAARASSRPPAPADPRGVCFHSPAEGEILADAGKLVGSAQRTEGRAILQHGSILIDGSQDRAAATGAGPGVADAGSSTTLRSLLDRIPDDAELIASITDAFMAGLGIRLAPATLSAGELDRLAEAEACYRSGDWTWRT